jgi:hypothetical protein
MMLFVFAKNVFAGDSCSNHVVISEIYGGGGNKDATYKNDFIELYNPTISNVDISNWSVQYASASSNKSFSVTKLDTKPENNIIKAGGYYLIEESKGSGGTDDLPTPDAIGTISLSATAGKVALVKSIQAISGIGDENVVDFVGYGNANQSEGSGPAKYPSDNSEDIFRKNKDCLDSDDNKNDFDEHALDPQNSLATEDNDNGEDDQKDMVPICKDKIILSEIFPFSGEFVEVENTGAEKCDLAGWKISDEKNSSHAFSTNSFIEADGFVAFVHDFGLNSASPDSARLFNPTDSNPIEISSYEKPESNKSYSRDESGGWKWTSMITADKKNEFDAKKEYPNVKLNINDDVFINVYADFEILGLAKKAKVTWDFGDGHKSYLQKTRHKYSALGKYSASVKFSEGSEDVMKSFTVEVTEVPHPSVKITAVNANPQGSDTDLESLTILNKTKKKINLIGWSIATGWKKLYNHPITADFIIKAGKEKEITREFSKFTLNNEKTKIELRYPDGEVAYEMKYKKKKGSVAEEEIYRKGKSGWSWLAAKQETKTKIQNTSNIQETIFSNQIENKSQENAVVDEVVEIAKADIRILPVLPVRKNNVILLSAMPAGNIKLLNSQPQVLGTQTVREIDGIYHFTPQFSEPEHYAVVFLRNISVMINARINNILNLF